MSNDKKVFLITSGTLYGQFLIEFTTVVIDAVVIDVTLLLVWLLFCPKKQ